VTQKYKYKATKGDASYTLCIYKCERILRYISRFGFQDTTRKTATLNSRQRRIFSETICKQRAYGWND